MSELVLDGVVAGYGDTTVLTGLDLVVPSGRTTAVLGRSGSGKSTMLRAIAGLVPIEAGTIRLGGRDLAGVPTHRRDVGMVFQHLALFPHVDVAENVRFPLRLAGRRGADLDREVDGWLERVGLGELRDRDVSTLSGGQRQRVALVRALAARPAALLLDEPLGAIDAGLRQELLQLLRALFDQEGTTAVHVTHDPAEAAAIADQLAVLDRGVVVQVDDPHRVWSAPASATVARLVGHANVLDPDQAAALGLARVDGALVLPPEAIEVVDVTGATVLGEVRALTGGATWHATVEVTDGPAVVVAVDPADAPALRSHVGLRIKAGRLVQVPA